ncbi:hypothetical protein J3F84DRAFT_333622 [Trichoderma pleuroticola]
MFLFLFSEACFFFRLPSLGIFDLELDGNSLHLLRTMSTGDWETWNIIIPVLYILHIYIYAAYIYMVRLFMMVYTCFDV